MKGQLSVEFLVITSVLLVVLGTVLYIVTTEYQSANQNMDSILARKALKDLMSAAKEVHSQGDGAKRLVRVSVPNNVDYSHVAANHLRYRMNLAGNMQDIVEPSEFCLVGYLPDKEGSQWVTVESIGNCVRVGDETYRVSPTRVDFRLYPGESQSKKVNISNLGSDSLNFSNTLSGSTLVSIDSINGTVPPASYEEITVLASTLASTNPGYYASELSVNVGFLTHVYVSVLVLSEKNLTLYPEQNDVASYAGGNATDDFLACNNGDTQLSNIQFSCSGAYCSWISYPQGSTITGLNPNKCQPVKLLITVPEATPAATYSSTITAQAGDGTYDSSRLNVTVINSAIVTSTTTISSTSSSTITTSTASSTTSTTLQTCDAFCQSNGYTQGTCRQNIQQCTNNGETHLPAGDANCIGGAQEDVCCCA